LSGAAIAWFVWTVVLLRVPSVRRFIFKTMGSKSLPAIGVIMKPLAKMIVLAVLFSACSAANGSEKEWSPGFDAEATMVGSNLAVVVTWTPGTTDSITFTASVQAGPQVAQSTRLAPFANPAADTLVLGARPAPGVTVTYDVEAAGTYIDRGIPTPFNQLVGSVSWTEPQPAGTPPGFSPPTIDSTLGSGPPPPAPTLVAIDIIATDADSFTVAGGYWTAPGRTVQFCAMAIMSDGLWRAGDDGVTPAPQVCLDSATARNALGRIPGADLWMMRMAHRKKATVVPVS